MNLDWLAEMDADLAELAAAKEWTRPDDSTTAHELARSLGLSRKHAGDRLLDLWKQGKLVRRRMGNSFVYYSMDANDGGDVYHE